MLTRLSVNARTHERFKKNLLRVSTIAAQQNGGHHHHQRRVVVVVFYLLFHLVDNDLILICAFPPQGQSPNQTRFHLISQKKKETSLVCHLSPAILLLLLLLFFYPISLMDFVFRHRQQNLPSLFLKD